MKTTPFTIDVLTDHKGFFLLDKIPAWTEEIDISIQTPRGFEPVDFVDAYTMRDGSVLVAWGHPFQKLGLHNLVATAGDITQVVNLYTAERIIDIYNKPVDSDFGVFVFTKSSAVDSGDWRCDRGYYGAGRFVEDIPTPMVSSLEDIIMYEPFLSVAGFGHLFYMEISKNPEAANERLNNSIFPSTGRTFQEILRLVYEWSVLSKEPFNDTSDVAVSAGKYFDALLFSDDEVQEIESMPLMQVGNYLSGSETARRRPESIPGMSDGVKDILFDRMGSSSLSFIVSRNPEIWDFEEVFNKETVELEAGIERFKTYYGIPIDVSIEETDKVQEIAKLWVPRQESYVHNQVRNFQNKIRVLSIASGNEKLI